MFMGEKHKSKNLLLRALPPKDKHLTFDKHSSINLEAIIFPYFSQAGKILDEVTFWRMCLLTLLFGTLTLQNLEILNLLKYLC